MYTAKIQGKSYNEGVLWVNVEFTNGVDKVVIGMSPQDETALKMWVKEKLSFFNQTKSAIESMADGVQIDVSEPTPETPIVPNDVKLRREWIDRYNKWVKVKNTLIDTGILTGAETPLVNLKNKVKTDFLPDYINYI